MYASTCGAASIPVASRLQELVDDIGNAWVLHKVYDVSVKHVNGTVTSMDVVRAFLGDDNLKNVDCGGQGV